MRFLAAGGSDEPLIILKKVGIDFTDQAMYEPIIDELQKLINQLAELLQVSDELF